MPLQVLVVPDKFKGTLPARDAAEAIARGWRRARPDDRLELLPMSDGGDGFGEVIGAFLGAELQMVRTVDAAHRPCLAPWWWAPARRTAVIESAAVIGLAMLPARKFHPFDLDTAGLAAVIEAAARRGARRCLIGIGGSATNDGGFGMTQALGWRFVDRHGKGLTRWIDLSRLASLHPPRKRRWFQELQVAVDVGNPLLGRRGATRVYGPQKGLRRQDFKPAEANLRRLAATVRSDVAPGIDRLPGSGAAGGLGFGLAAFLGGHLVPGFDLFSKLVGLREHLRNANLVLTGEGAIDRSTLMGKGTGRIADLCGALRKPCIGFAGSVHLAPAKRRAFSATHPLTALATLEQAMIQPAFWLERLAERAALHWQASSQIER